MATTGPRQSNRVRRSPFKHNAFLAERHSRVQLVVLESSRCSPLPAEIWLKIASYVHPNPVHFVRLAHVSRLFYVVFRSDMIWKYINPYGHANNFAHHFDMRVRRFSPEKKAMLVKAWPILFDPSIDGNGWAWGNYNKIRHVLKVWSWCEYEDLDITLGRLACFYCHDVSTRQFPHVFVRCLLFLRADLFYDFAKLYHSDRELVEIAVAQIGNNIEFANDHLKDDDALAMKAVTMNGTALAHLSERLRANKQLVMTAVRCNGIALRYAKDFFKTDRQVVSTAVENDFYALRYASEELQADRDIGLIALKPSTSEECRDKAYAIIQGDLLRDKKLALEYVKRSNIVYAFLDSSLKEDKDIAADAFRFHGDALEFAPQWMRSDRDLVRVAVRSSPFALEFASAELRDDPEIVSLAVENYSYPFQFASDNLQSDFQLASKVSQVDPHGLQYVSDEYYNDRDFIMNAIIAHGAAIQYAPERLRNDSEVVLAAMHNYPLAYRFAGSKARADQRVYDLARKAIATGQN